MRIAVAQILSGTDPADNLQLVRDYTGRAAESGGARLKLRATVEVRIPLVGGKLENFVGSQLVELLIREQRFTTTWIGENA